MSSMKKNALAAALVAGLGMAGVATAYNYGTNPNLAVPENVAYQNLFSPSWNYQMTEGLVFDIEVPDNAANISEGFTVRIALNSRCTPHDAPTSPASPVTNVPVCANTGDGAAFNTLAPPIPTDLVLDPTVDLNWDVAFDGYSAGHGGANTVASFRITPTTPNPSTPSVGTLLTWNNARLTSLNEFANGTTNKVDAEFWMVNVSNDSRFVNSTMSRTILNRVSGVTACANNTGSDINKYIDVADNFLENQDPKTRFSFDGKLGSAVDSAGGTVQAPGNANSQVIDLGDVTITNNGAGSFAFLATDSFTTVITGSNGDDWFAFDNGAVPLDDVYLFNGTCASGVLVAQGQISGNAVTFTYTAAAAGLPTTTGPSTTNLTVCAFQDTARVIDDHPNNVTTTFTRANAIVTPVFGPAGCALLPLRYNGSTMEIFTINPAVNNRQRSFIRLTNRSQTPGYVRLEGIDDNGVNAAGGQVSVWLPAGASVQLTATDLENGSVLSTGAWGAGAGKWRAVVTAEFPGLVASSYVRNTIGDILANITESDTRGEQIDRDWAEGSWGSDPGQRPSDFIQEFEPDFQGNGSANGIPGGPNNGQDPGPSGGQSRPRGNPGVGTP